MAWVFPFVAGLPVGTAYAVWTGIGATGTAILGVVLFEAPVTALRIASMGPIIAGSSAGGRDHAALG